MSLRLLFGALPRTSARSFARYSFTPRTGLHTSPHASRYRIGLVSAGVITTGLVLASTQSFVHADGDEDIKEHKSKSFSSYLRAYVVYTICSIPQLVDWSPTILSTLSAIPVIKHITEAVVRVTFFNQFVGAETAEESVPLLEDLRAQNKGCLFAYSVEVDEDDAAGQGHKDGKGKVSGTGNELPGYKRAVKEMLYSIDVAAQFEDSKANGSGKDKGRRTWVAIKLTALLPDHQSLTNLSKHIVQTRLAHPLPPVDRVPFPGTPEPSDLDVLYARGKPTDSPLTAQDITDLEELHKDLVLIAEKAKARGIRIIMDAEHSWYQPAVDAFALSLMSKFNTTSPSSSSPETQPLIYTTYQAYLRRTPSHLRRSIEVARAYGFALGVKLVRGAYHPHETTAHLAARAGNKSSLSISPDDLPPVWGTKDETDAAYNECVKVLVAEIAKDVTPMEEPSRSVKSLFGFSKVEQKNKVKAPTIGVLFGTHNWFSSKLVLSELERHGLATPIGETKEGEKIVQVPDEVAEQVTVAQLYGMNDGLTDYIVSRVRSTYPFVIKYIPYGSLADVMPYLARRAIENKSVLGDGAADMERRTAWDGMKKQLFG